VSNRHVWERSFISLIIGRIQVGKVACQAIEHDWFLLIDSINHIKSLGEQTSCLNMAIVQYWISGLKSSFRISSKFFHRKSFDRWIITIWSSVAIYFYYKYLINVFIFNINIFDVANNFHLNKKNIQIYTLHVSRLWYRVSSHYLTTQWPVFIARAHPNSKFSKLTRKPFMHIYKLKGFINFICFTWLRT